MCSALAGHTWHALGGNQNPPSPPAWGCSDANECVDKVKASGRYWTPQTWSGPPPRGAWVGWKYGNNGHAALSNGDGTITTTDPSSGAMVGTEPLDYPKRWGFSTANGKYSVWSDQYAGVRFAVESPIDHGDVYLSKLAYGQQDSDSVKRLQMHLNAHPLEGGQNLPISGNYLDETDEEVRLCQQQHGYGSDPVGGSSVGPKQAAHLIAGCACVIHDDTQPEPEPEPPMPESGGAWHEYSGKPSGTLTVTDSAGYVMVDADVPDPPVSGLEFHMLYANCDLTWDSGSQDGWIRVKYVREGGDATGYQDYSVVRGMADFLIQPIHWEAGEKGIGGRWYINVGGGIAKAVVATRYVKIGGVGF